MSNPDEPKKKAPPPATLQWDPEEGPPPGGETPPPEETDPEEDPLIGQLIRDKWRVLKKLGAGSFGTVYKVRDEVGGWIEALKILGVDRLTGADADNARKRFLREAQIMKRLGNESAHIVGLSTYEEDLEAGLIYFLMEFVEGRPLADVVAEEGPLSVERTVRLAIQVCEGLIVAHEGPEGVVHRDLKLENIMITTDRSGAEIAKILDFGIAKIAERETDTRLTTVGTLGTPGYAAPEQLRAEDVDGRTDLFAFGVILYSLLTGVDPWLGNPASEPTHQIYELMVATERGEVRPMAASGVEVPTGIHNVVMRLLRRNPDERFASARELKEVLERIAEGGEAADAGSLRVLTDEPGVEVQIRSGRQVVAEGPTPCIANGISAGTYRIAVRDPRYEAVETTVTLGAGAMDDVTLVTTPRGTGVGANLRRRLPQLGAAAVVGLLLVGAAFLRPWGRTLDTAGLEARGRAGGVASVRLSARGIEGRLMVAGLPAPYRVPLGEHELPAAVADLRSAGLEVDTSWEVARLVGLAAVAQSQMRYFGHDGDDVRGYAERAAALEPGSAEAMSLLLKVAEHMAWDAEAARQDRSPDVAEQLVRECLSLVPDHPRCVAAGGDAQL